MPLVFNRDEVGLFYSVFQMHLRMMIDGTWNVQILWLVYQGMPFY